MTKIRRMNTEREVKTYVYMYRGVYIVYRIISPGPET